MGKLDGRVALVTGAARGQGRAHALALAREGADVALVDVPSAMATVPYPLSTRSDLDQTVAEVEQLDRRSVGIAADVRDRAQVEDLVGAAQQHLGPIDVLVVNHGVTSYHEIVDLSDEAWQDVIDTNLTGAFHCLRAVLPGMIERQRGRVILTSSGLARQGQQQLAHYVASKWGILALTKSAALEVATLGITVNAVLPSTVRTPMILHDASYRLFRPDLEHPTAEDIEPVLSQLNAMGVPWAEPEDIASLVVYLASDEGRYITGAGIDVGAGFSAHGTA